MPDINFDQLSDRFKRNIYGTTKGRVRLEVCWRDLCEAIPAIQQQVPMRILDAGCGMAQLSAKMAGMGHHLVLNDISQSMLDAACEAFAGQDLKHEYLLLKQPLQQLDEKYHNYFDLVLNHAVLEWLESPQQAVEQLTRLVKPGGYLSLMFYNIHSLVFRNLVRGNLNKVERADWAGTGENSLTPISPLDPNDVYQWINNAGFKVVTRSGVRVFQDYMCRQNREGVPDDEIVKMEVQFSRKEPYMNMGRYIHVVCRKA